MPTSCAARCPEGVSSGSSVAPWVALTLLVAFLIFTWWRRRHVLWIDPRHPLMLEARRQAQETLDVLRALQRLPGSTALVMFRFDFDEEVSERLWGELQAAGPDDFTADIVTPPRFYRGAFERTVTLPRERLIDWQVKLADGTLRGGFTHRVEIRLRRQAGKSIPPVLAEMGGRFVDPPSAR